MEIDRILIENISKETQFQPDVIEKAYRLALLLQEINNHPVLNKELVLKGGTVINFIYLPLPRLSVDLDFNFVGGITKEEKDLKREDIKMHLNRIFDYFKYKIEENNEYGQHQIFLNYKNSASNNDIIKVEVNYLLRISVLSNKTRKIKLPFLKNLDANIKTLSLEEIYGAKIKALITRGAARDLYDVYNFLVTNIKFKKSLLKKLVIFFGCLDRKDFRKFSSDSICEITEKDIKNDLMPLLRKGTVVSRGKMIKTVKPLLEYVLKLDKQGKRYVDDFFIGEYKPELLFTNEKVVDIESLKKHPMALWKQQHIKEWLKNK